MIDRETGIPGYSLEIMILAEAHELGTAQQVNGLLSIYFELLTIITKM